MLDFISTERFDTAEPVNDETSNLFWVNEIENTVDSNETAVAFFDRRDEYKWKWISFLWILQQCKPGKTEKTKPG